MPRPCTTGRDGPERQGRRWNGKGEGSRRVVRYRRVPHRGVHSPCRPFKSLSPLHLTPDNSLSCRGLSRSRRASDRQRHSSAILGRVLDGVGEQVHLSLAKTPSAMEPLTIPPRARILPGPMLRLLGALLPTLRSDRGSQRDRVVEPPVLRSSGLRFRTESRGRACPYMPVIA